MEEQQVQAEETAPAVKTVENTETAPAAEAVEATQAQNDDLPPKITKEHFAPSKR